MRSRKFLRPVFISIIQIRVKCSTIWKMIWWQNLEKQLQRILSTGKLWTIHQVSRIWIVWLIKILTSWSTLPQKIMSLFLRFCREMVMLIFHIGSLSTQLGWSNEQSFITTVFITKSVSWANRMPNCSSFQDNTLWHSWSHCSFDNIIQIKWRSETSRAWSSWMWWSHHMNFQRTACKNWIMPKKSRNRNDCEAFL